MSRLSDALARVAAALERLEAHAENRIALCRDAQNSATELSVLESERKKLIARIAELENKTHTLARLTEEVEDRLDRAIAEIRGVLARNGSVAEESR